MIVHTTYLLIIYWTLICLYTLFGVALRKLIVTGGRNPSGELDSLRVAAPRGERLSRSGRTTGLKVVGPAHCHSPKVAPTVQFFVETTRQDLLAI
jgi:hypothetical protein